MIEVSTDFIPKQDKIDSFESLPDHQVHETTLDTVVKRT